MEIAVDLTRIISVDLATYVKIDVATDYADLPSGTDDIVNLWELFQLPGDLLAIYVLKELQTPKRPKPGDIIVAIAHIKTDGTAVTPAEGAWLFQSATDTFTNNWDAAMHGIAPEGTLPDWDLILVGFKNEGGE